jgi:hypothetical protein
MKRGQGMTTYESSWNSNSADWARGPSNTPTEELTSYEFSPVFVPNGKEEFSGFKSFNGETYCVFKCLDDSYVAQRKSVCELPVPNDPMKVLSIVPVGTKPDRTMTKVLVFRGANWKLCSSNKWTSEEIEFDQAGLKVIGGRDIDGTLYKVAQYDGNFIAYQ